MAREWGIPPWQIVAEAPLVWIDRWYALREAMLSARDADRRRAAAHRNGAP